MSVVDEISSNVTEHVRAGCSAFPGSKQAQSMPWSHATELFNGRDGRPADRFESYFYLSVNHSDFDPDWPISTDWPAVVRGVRGALGRTQAEFAGLLGLGRATVERWEAGTTKPFRGNGLELLTLLRPHLRTPVQAGQALNVAAAVVLPHITQPTAEYSGQSIANLLNQGAHNHADMGPALLNALSTSHILVAIDPTGNELEDRFFPLAARFRPTGDLPRWASDLIDNIIRLDDRDRRLVTDLVGRLDRAVAINPR